ncbi:restriction endonuclease subunit S [Vibrio fluvialis]|uniref:restriction endonuclease subunit S n=1 Tax=Vibrio fluvialis TaxID=676 RepID=UPI0028F71B67|nr:restriction endonuclease subunit S [Vibrio fluvialis]
MTKWKSQQLSNLASITMGSSPKSTAYNDEGIGLPLIQGNADIKNRLTKPRTYTSQITKECAPGGIIMTVRAPVGAIAKSTVKGCIGRGVCAISATKISQDYLYQYLISQESKWKKLEQGSTFSAIGSKDVKQLLIAYPESVKEQAQIAGVLSTVDKKIDLIDQKIAETEKLKTGLMQKLFSEGIGVQDENGDWQPHAEFEDNGLPMHWGFLKLGSVAKVTSGGTPSRKKASFWENGTIPWITTGEVNFNCITNSSQKITDEGLKNSAAKMFPPDTILMAMYGQGQTRGRVAMLGIEASTNQACAAIICSKKLNPHFCYHYLSSQYEKIRAIGNEGSQKNLNGQIIKDILIPCPNLEEQEQIALVLSTVDEKITLLAKQKSETQQLKKGLMQKLLTGEWRVPVEETEAA